MKNNKSIFFCVAFARKIFEQIEASSKEEALKLFKDRFGISPDHITGRFKKVKERKDDIDVLNIKFRDNKPHKAIYNGWKVNAFLLETPNDHALIFPIHKIENEESMSWREDKKIVYIDELRFTHE